MRLDHHEVEANAIRNSPLGEMLLECLNADGADDLEDFRRETGIDPLQDLRTHRAVVVGDEATTAIGSLMAALFLRSALRVIATRVERATRSLDDLYARIGVGQDIGDPEIMRGARR